MRLFTISLNVFWNLSLCMLVFSVSADASVENTSSRNTPSDDLFPELLDTEHTTTQQTEFPEERLGWNLSVQTYTFKNYSLVEAISMARSADLKTIEVFANHELGGGLPGAFEVEMAVEQKQALRKLLRDSGIRIVALGVVNADSEAGWRQLFEFAHEWGVYVINVEPAPEFLPLIGRLADKFKIRVAIHNHPKPSRYWDPNVVLQSIEKAESPFVGACADIGHWIRSGLDPVKALQDLEGHVFSLHFKDLKEQSRDTRDVHWGTGVANVEGLIRELKRQNFRGNISAEYEYNWENNVVDVRQSVQNFRAVLNKLL